MLGELERKRERRREKERVRRGERDINNEGGKECVCVCVCEGGGERERETEVFPCSVPELSLCEAQGLTSDHVKELREEVDKLAQEKIGEVSETRHEHCGNFEA